MRKRDGSATTRASDRVVALALPPTSPAAGRRHRGPRDPGRTTLLRDVVDRLQREAVWVDCSVFAYRTPWRSMHEVVSSTSPQVFPAEMAEELADRLATSRILMRSAP